MKKKKLRLKRSFQIILISLILLLGVSFYQLIKNTLENKENPLVSAEVLKYEDLMIKYARENHIEDYLELLQAMMMQESGGKGNDPMQSSECEFNTQFDKVPNAINKPEYSIKVGTQYFAKCLQKADVKDKNDKNGLYLALQAYNYGIGYIDYVNQKDKKYTYQNAIDFSEKCKKEYDVNVYGDSKYVYHVLRYYTDTSLVDDWLEEYR
ncbi:MAG: lysozyme family protein [Faecalibacillus sp.]